MELIRTQPFKRTIFAGFIVLILFFLIVGCSKHNNLDQRILVVVSILPLAEFVEKIGADRVSVTVMVEPGASPHSYELTPQQLRQVSETKMYVKLGAPIEFELVMVDKLIALNSKMLVID